MKIKKKKETSILRSKSKLKFFQFTSSWTSLNIFESISIYGIVNGFIIKKVFANGSKSKEIISKNWIDIHSSKKINVRYPFGDSGLEMMNSDIERKKISTIFAAQILNDYSSPAHVVAWKVRLKDS